MKDYLLLITDGSHHGEDANHEGNSKDKKTKMLPVEHGKEANHGGGSIDEVEVTLHMKQEDFHGLADEGVEDKQLVVHSGLKTNENNGQQSESHIVEQSAMRKWWHLYLSGAISTNDAEMETLSYCKQLKCFEVCDSTFLSIKCAELLQQSKEEQRRVMFGMLALDGHFYFDGILVCSNF